MAGATIERFGMVTSLSLEVQGPGSAYILRISVLPIVWGVYIYILYRHYFSRTCKFLDFPEFFSFEYTHFWKDELPL